MRMLLIAPLPPPLTGHSLAAQVVLDDLQHTHQVDVVNLSLGSSNVGAVSRRRILEVAKVLAAVWRKKRGVDAIYLTIAESVAGNIKDLLIYVICARQLSRFYIHLHGGSIKKLLFDRHPLLRWLNVLAVRRLAGVIISGRSHEHIFAPMIDRRRIHIVPNFAQDGIFVPEEKVVEKFVDVSSLRVIYVSGMIKAKGYLDLVEAYLVLDAEARSRVCVDFAGRFETDAERANFLERIARLPGIRYHGFVEGDTKRALFANAHVFCLPTTMFEGQPLSVIEAYAAGCVVMATAQDGIRDIFVHGMNGFEIEERSPRSIAAVIEHMRAMPAALGSIGLHNRRQAEARYRTVRFNDEVRAILESGHTDMRSLSRSPRDA